MARVEIPLTVEKIVGNISQPIPGVAVQVRQRGGGAAILYAQETLGATLANPIRTDANGEINAWIDEGSYDLVISGPGLTIRTVAYEAVRGDSAKTIDGSTRLIDNSVTTAKLQNATTAGTGVTTAKIQDASIPPGKFAPGSGFIPSGAIVPFVATSPPSGWVLCDGASYPVSTLPDLFSAIGYTFGGSGATFSVPDGRGRALIGSGTDFNINAVGKNDGIIVGSRVPTHSHTISNDGAHTHSTNLHSHNAPAHSHDVSDHTHAILGNTGQAGQALNQIGGAASYGSIWGYQQDPGPYQTGGGSPTGGVSPTGTPLPPGTQGAVVRFVLLNHTHPIFMSTYGAGAQATSSWSGVTDGQAPAMNNAPSHNHGGVTSTASSPYLVAQYIIKT